MVDGKPAFVTVVLEPEIPHLHLQARSLPAERDRRLADLDRLACAAGAQALRRRSPRQRPMCRARCQEPRDRGADEAVLRGAGRAAAGPRVRLPRSPVRPALEHVLGYLGVDPAPSVDRFTATVTPLPRISRRARPCGRLRLIVPAWRRAAVRRARETRSHWYAVHRQALARLDAAAVPPGGDGDPARPAANRRRDECAAAEGAAVNRRRTQRARSAPRHRSARPGHPGGCEEKGAPS